MIGIGGDIFHEDNRIFRIGLIDMGNEQMKRIYTDKAALIEYFFKNPKILKILVTIVLLPAIFVLKLV